ncbi:MAG: DUF3800 domain-containing protein [Actinomycetota bacterium]
MRNDFVAFIDESGDESFNFNKCEEWFIVSGILTTHQESNDMIQTIKSFNNKYRKNAPPLHKLTFKELSYQQRLNLLGMLKKHKYITIHSAFYKPGIDPDDRLCTYPSMYFFGILTVIERLTWATNQFIKNKVHILISNRNKIKKKDLQEYLFNYSVKHNFNNMYMDKLGIVSLGIIIDRPKLLLADYAASSMTRCLEKKSEAHIIQPIYFDILLKGKLYSSKHRAYGGVWKNGFKCTPDYKTLLEYDSILEEGSHKF